MISQYKQGVLLYCTAKKFFNIQLVQCFMMHVQGGRKVMGLILTLITCKLLQLVS